MPAFDPITLAIDVIVIGLVLLYTFWERNGHF